jgi:gp16 family phage-associated protein
MSNSSPKLRTTEEVKADLRRRGRSVPQVAAEIQVSPRIVYAVLAGRHKGLRGQAHRAAVLLGLKDGVVE